MTMYRAGDLAAPATAVALSELPDKVRRNASKLLPLVEGEQLVLLVDTTLLGSGKEGIAITNLRLLSYDKSQLKLNLAYRGLQSVSFVTLAYDAHGLEIVRSGGRSLKLKVTHAEKDQIELLAREIQARMKPAVAPTSSWQCPSCGPGEIIYLEQVRYTSEGGEPSAAAVALIARDLHICRRCGQATLRIEDPSLIDPAAIPGAELKRSG